MSWPLRPAVEADRESVTRLVWCAFYERACETWGPPSASLEAEQRAAWSPQEPGAAWEVVEQAGELVAALKTRQAPGHDYLGTLAVGPAWQNRGIGGHLVRSLIGRAQDRGVPLWLSVYRHNPARHMYVRLGFGWEERDALRLHMAWPSDTRSPPPYGPKAVPEGWVAPPVDLPIEARLPQTAPSEEL